MGDQMAEMSSEIMKEIQRLHIVAGRETDALFMGDYRSAMRGQGMEFEEVRTYVPGDDIRHIDWNVTARTGAPYIKVFREERELTVVLLVDVSGSIRLGMGGKDGLTDKRRQIARIAGGVAFAGIRNRDRIGLLTFTDRIETFLSPRRTRGHVFNVIQKVFEAQGSQRGTNLSEALTFLSRVQRRRAAVVVISDFQDEGDWQGLLGSLARRHRVHGIVVTDPLDQGLSGLGLVEAVDAETGVMSLIDSGRWTAQQQTAQRLADLRKLGVSAVEVSTTENPFLALQRHFKAHGVSR